jgi:hypothetical protein
MAALIWQPLTGGCVPTSQVEGTGRPVLPSSTLDFLQMPPHLHHRLQWVHFHTKKKFVRQSDLIALTFSVLVFLQWADCQCPQKPDEKSSKTSQYNQNHMTSTSVIADSISSA